MVGDEKTVQRYIIQREHMLDMLDNLLEFVETMPAPDEDGNIPNVDYGYTGSVGRIWEMIKQASDIADDMSI